MNVKIHFNGICWHLLHKISSKYKLKTGFVIVCLLFSLAIFSFNNPFLSKDFLNICQFQHCSSIQWSNHSEFLWTKWLWSDHKWFYPTDQQLFTKKGKKRVSHSKISKYLTLWSDLNLWKMEIPLTIFHLWDSQHEEKLKAIYLLLSLFFFLILILNRICTQVNEISIGG